MSFSIQDVRLDGCIMEPASPRSYKTAFQERDVPDRVDLRDKCTKVENQGRIGSCTANAAVGAMEYHYNCAQGWAPELSRLFVYFNARRLRGAIMEDTGATIPEAMAALLAYGSCPEEVWPYDPQLFAMEPPQQVYMEAKKHVALQYARVDKVNGSIHALAEGLPVVFGTWLPQRLYEQAAQTGVMPPSTEAERRAQPSGGHAMLMVGYDKAERMFIVRNSWGEGWGDRGYCRIPFDEIDYFSPPDQFWVVMTLAGTGNFRVIKPGEESASSPRVPEMQTGGMSETAARMREQIRSGLASDLDKASSKVDELLSGSSLHRDRSRGAGNREAPAGERGAGAYGDYCTMCRGSGMCFYCGGSGKASSTARPTPCARCSGSGRCYPCSGSGGM